MVVQERDVYSTPKRSESRIFKAAALLLGSSRQTLLLSANISKP
jgi:hypothetical protein